MKIRFKPRDEFEKQILSDMQYFQELDKTQNTHPDPYCKGRIEEAQYLLGKYREIKKQYKEFLESLQAKVDKL